jgi:hypothetical protein
MSIELVQVTGVSLFIAHPRPTASDAQEKLQLRESMANVYVEPRPKGRPEGSRIEDYVVEDQADHVLGTFTTQHKGIEWAKHSGHAHSSPASGTSMIRRSPITGRLPEQTSLKISAQAS